MKKIRYKPNLVVLCILVVIGTSSVGFVGAQAQKVTVTITVFDHATAGMYDHANTTITIPCFQDMLSCRMVFEGYCDPDDKYLRCLTFFVDGNFSVQDPEGYMIGQGGYIGTEQLGDHFQFGCGPTLPDPCGLIYRGEVPPGEHKTWIFNMSECAFANHWSHEYYPGWHYKSFIPESAEDTVGYFSPGEHLIEACITSEPAKCGPKYETWISIKLEFELIPCAVGSLFSDVLAILPVAVLAGVLVVLRRRRNHPPAN